MALGTRSYTRGYLSSGGLPPGIRALLIANVAIFLLQSFSRGAGVAELFGYLQLMPAAVVKFLFIWQLGTYLFLHGNLFHILFNMLALWWFGSELERLWGTRKFLRFYFFCGVGAGICVVVLNYLFGDPTVRTIGSSGAIYGILLASAFLWPDREMLFYFLFPIKTKYFVMIIGAIAFYHSFNPSSPVSEIAHLGGMAFAFLFLKIPKVRGFDPFGTLKYSYQQWRIARAKRRFQVYMRKHGSDRDKTIH